MSLQSVFKQYQSAILKTVCPEAQKEVLSCKSFEELAGCYIEYTRADEWNALFHLARLLDNFLVRENLAGNSITSDKLCR